MTSHSQTSPCEIQVSDLPADSSQIGAKIIDNNLGLLISGEFADLKVRCNGFEFPVHKAMVCRHSPFFERACLSGFKESQDDIIELPEDYPGIVARIIVFCYTLHFPLIVHDGWRGHTKESFAVDKLLGGDQDHADLKQIKPQQDPWNLDFHIIVLVFILADKLMIEELKRLCKIFLTQRIKNTTNSNLEEATRLIYLQDSHMMNPLTVIVVYEWQLRVEDRDDAAPSIRSLIEAFPTFGCDMALSCKHRKFAWCADCHQWRKLKEKQCRCGLTGQCGSYNGQGCPNLLGNEEERHRSFCEVCGKHGTLRFEREE